MKWEEGVTGDAGRILRCSNWKLTAQEQNSLETKIMTGLASNKSCSALGWMDG